MVAAQLLAELRVPLILLILEAVVLALSQIQRTGSKVVLQALASWGFLSCKWDRRES